MRLLQRQRRKRNARLLASAQGADGLQSCHAGDLEVAQVLAVLLICFPWKFVCQELNGVHRRDERVHVVLGKVSPAAGGWGWFVSGGKVKRVASDDGNSSHA